MPRYAYMHDKTGQPIDANDVPISSVRPKFFCCTKNCDAEMILYKPGTNNAYFASKHKKDHVSSMCIKNSIIFKESTYNESLFDKDFAFECMLGLANPAKKIIRGMTGTQTGTVGGSKNNRIHTLASLYAMCLSRGKNGNYNGIPINDILADNENYNMYQNGITGYKIVETSKYYEITRDLSFMMNYPADNRVIGQRSWVKITFDLEELFDAHFSKLKNSNHIEPVIIAGDWKAAPNNAKHHSECVIHAESQVYYAKEQ